MEPSAAQLEGPLVKRENAEERDGTPVVFFPSVQPFDATAVVERLDREGSSLSFSRGR